MKTNINFIKIKNITVVLSVLVILFGLWNIFGPRNLPLGVMTPRGFNLGIDFQGGVSQSVVIYSGIPIDKVREFSIESGLGDNVQEVILNEKTRIGKSQSFMIKTNIKESEKKMIDERKVKDAEYTEVKFLQERKVKFFNLVEKFTQSQFEVDREALKRAGYSTYNAETGYGVSGEIVSMSNESKAVLENVAITSSNTVSSTYSETLRSQAFWLIGFVLAVMLIYVTIRFKFEFAIGAVVALIHDTVIMIGFISFFGVELDMTVVAGILTLIGYSINDTIVVFDRIRENYEVMKGSHAKVIINGSINQTLSRTVVTSLTTLLSVAALYFFGGPTIHGFSFVLFWGIIVGTYSSIFIASPIVYLWDKSLGKEKAKYKKLEEKEAEEVSKVNKEESSDESVNESNAPLRDEDISLKKLKKLSGKKKK